MSIILELGLRGSAVFLVVALLDRMSGGRMGAASRRWWWLLVPLAFLAPVHLPVIPAPPLRVIVLDTVTSVPLPATLRSGDGEVARPGASARSTDWQASATRAWLAGAIAYLGLVIVRTVRTQRRWSDVRLCTDPALLDLLEDCKREAGVTAPIGLVVSPSVQSVAILGWLRPRILIPDSLVATLPREHTRAVLLHELAHFHYGDVPATWLFTLARALHWFNPFAHWACAVWIRFREEAADEAAIRWMRERSGQAYGEVLLQTLRPAASAAPFGALGIGESFRHLEQRLLMIRHFPRKSPRWSWCAAVAVPLIAVTAFPLSPGDSLPEPAAPDEAIWAAPNIPVTVPTSVLDAIAGRYDYVTAILTVNREGDRLFAKLPGQPRAEIFPKSKWVYFWKVAEAQVAFIRNDHGEVVSAMHHQGGNTLIAARIAAIPVADIDPAVFDDYVGEYRPAGADVTMTVSRDGNRFFVQVSGQPKLEVFPKSETEFFLKVVHAQLTFVTGPDGRAMKVINRQAGQRFEFLRAEHQTESGQPGSATAK